MSPNELPQTIIEVVSQHIPSAAAWVPLAIAVSMAVSGLVFMTKGAKLAPGLAALVFGLIGAGIGTLLPAITGTPYWPTVVGSALAGLLLGILLFRLWLAVLVGGCLVMVSMGVWSQQTLHRPVNDYLSAGLDRQRQMVTLPDALEAAAGPTTPQQELAGLWSHLSQNVPNFQNSFYAILISTGLAGLLFGLLLPTLARAFWAASLGTLLFGSAVYALLHMYRPTVTPWANQWGLVVMGVLWGISLIYNLADMHALGLKKRPSGQQKRAAA